VALAFTGVPNAVHKMIIQWPRLASFTLLFYYSVVLVGQVYTTSFLAYTQSDVHNIFSLFCTQSSDLFHGTECKETTDNFFFMFVPCISNIKIPLLTLKSPNYIPSAICWHY